MKSVVKIGTVGEERFVVSEQHLIDFAHDGHEKIARGTHKLRVIQAARLARKVEAKSRQQES